MNYIKIMAIFSLLIALCDVNAQSNRGTCTWAGSWTGSCTGTAGFPGQNDDVVIAAPVSISQCRNDALSLDCNNLTLDAPVTFDLPNQKITIWGSTITTNIPNSILNTSPDNPYVEIQRASLVSLAGIDSLYIPSGVWLDIPSSGTLATAATNLVIMPGAWITGRSLSKITGDVTVRQLGQTSTTSWNFWGTPLVEGDSEASKQISSANMTAGGMYSYIWGTSGMAGWLKETSSFNLLPGRGYSLMGGGGNGTDGIRYFKGALNVADGTVTPTGAPTSGWGLFANPFASMLQLYDGGAGFLEINSTELNGTAYFWCDDASTGTGYASDDYGSCNASGCTDPPGGGCTLNPAGHTVPPCQGFFVDIDAAGSVAFNLAMTENAPAIVGSFLRKKAVDTIQRIFLNVLNSQGIGNEMLLAFTDSATMGFDRTYDGKKIIVDGNLGIYSLLQNEPYAIQGLPKQSTYTIPIGIITNHSGDFTIKLSNTNNLPAGTTLHLEDLDNNIMHDLNTSDYIVNLPQDTFDNSFLLHVGMLATDLQETTKDEYTLVYNKGERLYIEGLRNLGTINSLEIFDLSGRYVFKRSYNKKMTSITEETPYKGLHIIRLQSERGVTIKKIFM